MDKKDKKIIILTKQKTRDTITRPKREGEYMMAPVLGLLALFVALLGMSMFMRWARQRAGQIRRRWITERAEAIGVKAFAEEVRELLKAKREMEARELLERGEGQVELLIAADELGVAGRIMEHLASGEVWRARDIVEEHRAWRRLVGQARDLDIPRMVIQGLRARRDRAGLEREIARAQGRRARDTDRRRTEDGREAIRTVMNHVTRPDLASGWDDPTRVADLVTAIGSAVAVS